MRKTDFIAACETPRPSVAAITRALIALADGAMSGGEQPDAGYFVAPTDGEVIALLLAGYVQAPGLPDEPEAWERSGDPLPEPTGDVGGRIMAEYLETHIIGFRRELPRYGVERTAGTTVLHYPDLPWVSETWDYARSCEVARDSEGTPFGGEEPPEGADYDPLPRETIHDGDDDAPSDARIWRVLSYLARRENPGKYADPRPMWLPPAVVAAWYGAQPEILFPGGHDMPFSTPPGQTDYGGYAVVYYDNGDDVCHDCIVGEIKKEGIAPRDPRHARFVQSSHQEGPAHVCEVCGRVEPSDYGDPDADDGDATEEELEYSPNN